MDEVVNRFFEVYEALKVKDRIKSYSQLGSAIGTNKAGVSDIKSGRKKLSIENLIGMKKSYDSINIEWILLKEGEMWKEPDENGNGNDNSKDDYIIELQRDKIKHLEKELAQAKKDYKPLSGYQNVAEPDG